MNRIARLSVIVVAMCGSSLGADTGDKALDAAVTALRGGKSADSIAKYIADEYITTHSNGSITDKKERLSAVGRTPSPDISEERSVRAGSVAIISSKQLLHTDPSDTTPRRVTNVWVQKPSGWVLVATHLARITARGAASALPPGTRPLGRMPPGLKTAKTVVGGAIAKAMLDAEAAVEAAATKEAYGALLADDVLWTTREGLIEDKAAHLAHVTFPPRGPARGFKDVEVRGYGDAAVVTGLEQSQVAGAGQTSAASVRFTHVWALRGGKWVIVANQSSPAANQ